EKKKRIKKEKENGLWKMPQLWKSAKQSVAFGRYFLMRIPTAAWKSLAKALGFSTFTTGPAAIHQYGRNFHLRYYKGWLRHQKNFAKQPKLTQPGWFSFRFSSRSVRFGELQTK